MARSLARLAVQVFLGLAIGFALIGPLRPWIKEIGVVSGAAIVIFLVFSWIVERRNRPDSN
jgi:hypothetical protein